jgi:hypothetical protein
MNKFRGHARYYRRLQRTANAFSIDLAADHWYEFWHIHPDMKGRSNLGGKHRRAHLRALFLMFDRLVAQLDDHERPYQTWIEINSVDGSHDALYFHTPNPNHLHRDPPEGSFPYSFPNVEWDVEPPPLFANFVYRDRMSVGIRGDGAERQYVVRVKS